MAGRAPSTPPANWRRQSPPNPSPNANGEPALLNGHKLTRVELLLRTWAQSKDPRLQIAFFEVAYGKTPTQQQTEIKGTLQIDDLRKLSDDELRAIVEG